MEVKKNSTIIATFAYDADGNRVQATENGTLTKFVGTYYEVTNPGSGQTVTKYYMADASRVAMRKYSIPSNMTVEYMLGDHLGSTSITTDNTGAKVSEMRYKPWGEVRSYWTATQTTSPSYSLADYTFTGQYSYMDDPSTGATEGFGLMFYNARWYDPYLNQFTQPDTIVPDLYNPQDWNRYAYARNNPVKYTDPTGHDPWWNDPTFYLKEYVEAGIFQQSLGFNLRPRWLLDGMQTASEKIGSDLLFNPFAVNFDYTGKGPAKVTDPQMKEEYGEEVTDPWGGQRGLGLGLNDLDQNNWDVASIAMGRRVAFFLVKVCSTGCNQSDQTTVAALAANGDLTVHNYKDLMRARKNEDFDIDAWVSSYYEGSQEFHVRTLSIPSFKARFNWDD